MQTMAKKTKTALHELIKALEKQVAVHEDPKAGRGKRDRATARVRVAVQHYDSVLHSRTGAVSAFLELPDPGLDATTVASLKAEKAALEAQRDARKKANKTD